jgi:hypothetical protein
VVAEWRWSSARPGDSVLIAAAIAEEIGREVDYRDVEVDGAERAAQRLSELL